MVDFYNPSPCLTYDPVITCNTLLLDPLAPAVSGVALQAASELIFYATGQRFDSCEVSLRPCRKQCPGAFGNYGDTWWEYGTYPRPVLISGTWYNIGCGDCGDGCSCAPVYETWLPGPVQRIVEVKEHGVVLTQGVDYRLDDYRKVVRLGALWPFCNDVNKADTEVDTWSITAVFGEPLPALGRLAVGELFCAILTDLLGNDCELPDGVTNVTRQGLSFTLQTTEELLESNQFNLPYTDKFIRTFNPHGLQSRSAVYDLDSPSFRITGTTIT